MVKCTYIALSGNSLLETSSLVMSRLETSSTQKAGILDRQRQMSFTTEDRMLRRISGPEHFQP